MKQLFYSILITSLFSACMSTTTTFGEKFVVKDPVSLNEVLLRIKTINPLKDIQIEGIIEKSCMSEGCWFTIKDSTGTEIKFDVKGKAFKVPTNSPGKTAVILADAAQDTASEQKVTLTVKGMLFK